MLDLENCVICGSSENLNTSMTIYGDGQKIEVKVCDEDADDATPKQVRQCYAEKQAQIAEVLKQAKALGLNVSPPSAGRAITTVERPVEPAQEAPVPPSSQPEPTLNPAIAEAISGSKEDGVLPTSVVDGVAQRIQGAAGGEANAEPHAAHNPNSLQDKLPAEARVGKVKMEAAIGRGGQPMAVPSVRVDGTGTTTVRIQQSVDDGAIQQRFKDLANSVDADGANKHSFATGYDVHLCPICRGDSTILNKGSIETCPKCGGTGLLNN
jgi:hypothetical protein